MAEDSSLYEWPAKHVVWKVKNFFDLPTKDDYSLDSPEFCFLNSKWSLRIFTNGCKRDNTNGYIGVILCKTGSALKCKVFITVGILNKEGLEENEDYNSKLLTRDNDKVECLHFIERSTLKKSKSYFVPDGTLTVYCTVRVSDMQPISPNQEATCLISVTSSVQTASQNLITSKTETQTPTSVTLKREAASWTPSLDSMQKLIDDLKDVHINKRYTDITVVVKGTEFLAHKVILAARSAVFAAMFDHEMSEKISGKVEILDCDPEYFEKFLLFLYTGKFDRVSSSNAVSLYKISEKYDVQELKEECRKCMVNEMNIDILCDVICLSAKYNEPELLKAAIHFFINNAKCVLLTTKWQNFLVQYPTLCNEILIKAFNK